MTNIATQVILAVDGSTGSDSTDRGRLGGVRLTPDRSPIGAPQRTGEGPCHAAASVRATKTGRDEVFTAPAIPFAQGATPHTHSPCVARGGYDPRGLQRAVGSTRLAGLSHISRSARQPCEPCSRGLGRGQPHFIRSSPWLKPYALRRESDVDGLLYEIQSHCARGCDQHGGDTGENEAAHYDPAGYHRSLKLRTRACEIKHDRAAIRPQGHTSHRRVQSAGRTRPCNSRADLAAGGVKLGEHPRCVRLPA
jgi:hypothetical protein